ncbi:MAG: hypothetical protein ACXW1R_08580 [Halobacteriota archaeon]|jgi:hypothetical protein
MNDIVSIAKEDDENEPIRIGDDSAHKSISFQLAQDFYNEITGKSERLTEKIQSSFVLTLSDIEQLNHRLVQSTEQYNVASENVAFSVKYVGDSGERFSSLERLKLHAGHKGRAIEEIDLVYNLLLVLPKTRRPQEYKISISLISRVAKIEGMRDEFDAFPFPVPLFQFERLKTGEATIDFVDITVANAIMSTIKSWADGLPTSQTSNILKVLRSKSRYAPVILKYGFLAVVTFYISKYSKELLTAEVGLRETAEFILYSILTSFVFYRIGLFIGEIAEKNLGQVYEISYINFTPADERLVEKSREKVVRSMFYSGASLFMAFAISISSSIVATYLLK